MSEHNEQRVVDLVDAGVPADQGLSSLGMLMQLGGNVFAASAAYFTFTLLFAIGGGGGELLWMLLVLGLSITRSLIQRAAGTHLLYGTPTSVRLRVGLTLVTFSGALLEIVGPWSVRYVSGACAYVLMAGWLLLAGGVALIVVITLLSMWASERWVGWFASPQEGDRS